MSGSIRSRVRSLAVAFAFAGGLAAPVVAQEGADAYQVPAAELVALVDAPATPGVSLSPDRSLMLLSERPELPSLAEVSAPELRIAGMRINPRTNGPSRARPATGLTIQMLDGSERAVTGLPANAAIRNTRWSPDGRHVAFTHDTESSIELWVLDVEAATARRLGTAAINDAYGAAIRWMSNDAILANLVPAGRGAAPEAPMVPTAPIVQENTGEVAPARTYQDLLENQHDADLFEYYATTQLAVVTLDGATTNVGEPGIIRSAEPSPDGEYVLVQTTMRPFSYLVPAYRFPTRIEVWDAAGNAVHLVADLPLQDNVPTSFGSVPTGVRSIGWRADADATLYWAEAQDGGDAKAEADIRDAIMMQAAPFDAEPTRIAELPLRYGGIFWSEDGFALINESWMTTRQRRTYRFEPDSPGALDLVFDVSMEDRYNDPGFPVFRETERGTGVLHTADGGRSIYLAGSGASPEGMRPFLRKMDLETGETEELFRSEAPYYEGFVSLLDDGDMIIRRESVDEPPNYYRRDSSGSLTAITSFPHPYPQFAGIRKEAIQYEREDGVPLSATLYLPADYDQERDGPLPTFVWAYPTEFKSADAAGQRRDSPYQFTRISYSGAVPWVTRGYAVLDNASMPVIGEGEEEPNDTFREQLVANAQAAIDEGVRRGVVDPDRVGVGGHSYGAFMTGNLLAHSDLFRAGVARSGAYNRTLTPFGFQREERLFWEDPDLYFEMSPFMHAEKVNEPILLIHGEADNNSGTFPIQSIRFYNALKGLGATARLVMLPAESHGYAARESVLHMMWEVDRWLDMYVKNAKARTATTTDDAGR
ncbi:MAG: prolyl oligopeptidase family serine peptidase [Gemmatimonadota bacterium]|nr:prolyl oligopeptidase family serine peptidase [Gemmatimonadota bacterium]